MKMIWTLGASLFLLAEALAGQSLGDLARQERERKAKEQKASIQVSTDEVRSGRFDLSPPLDPARKGNLDYLLQQLSHPKPSPELLAALVPLKEGALPKLLSLLASPDPIKRIAPATALTVLGNSEGLATLAHLLNDLTEAAASGATPPQPAAAKTTAQAAGAAASAAQPAARQAEKASSSMAPSAEALRKKIEQSRILSYALDSAKLGVWRFTDGSGLTPDQVAARLRTGPVEIVGGIDNGQRTFNRALRHQDPNLRRAAVALVRVATGGTDYGFAADQAADKNESAIQQITTFLVTERQKVVSQLGAKTQ
jgi:hypothetical protein